MPVLQFGSPAVRQVCSSASREPAHVSDRPQQPAPHMQKSQPLGVLWDPDHTLQGSLSAGWAKLQTQICSTIVQPDRLQWAE